MSSNTPPSLTCLNCGKVNPPKAFACIHCFKVLRPKENIPWWKTYIRLSTPMIVGICVAAVIGIITVKKWIENLEAQVSMNFKTDDYNVSVTADKKKKQALFDVKSAPSPAAEKPATE